MAESTDVESYGKHLAGTRRQVSAEYSLTRNQLTDVSAFRLRWMTRQLTRQRDQLDQFGLARLAAARDEMRDRGLAL